MFEIDRSVNEQSEQISCVFWRRSWTFSIFIIFTVCI